MEQFEHTDADVRLKKPDGHVDDGTAEFARQKDPAGQSVGTLELVGQKNLVKKAK